MDNNDVLYWTHFLFFHCIDGVQECEEMFEITFPSHKADTLELFVWESILLLVFHLVLYILRKSDKMW